MSTLLIHLFQKKEKRALANWKILVKGILIRDKLCQRWDLQEASLDSQQNSQVAGTDTEVAWPSNFDSEDREKFHLFPFEKKP